MWLVLNTKKEKKQQQQLKKKKVYVFSVINT